MSAFPEAAAGAREAGLRTELDALIAAHVGRHADGGYARASGYQHHARVIRQLSAELEAPS
jgi:hypothetical protein